MSYRISQTDPAQMTTEELTAELDGFIELAEEVAARMSVILLELRKRRQRHPFFHHPVLRFFQAIAEQELHPKAAIILGNREMIKAVIPLSHRNQLEIAHGRDVPVAVLNDTGQLERDDMPIHRMGPQTLRRVFGPEGIRSLAEQEKMLRVEGRIERHGAITVLRDEVMLKIGNQKVKPEDLRGPLMALGYSLDLARSATRRAG